MAIVTTIDTTCNMEETFAERLYRMGEEDGLEGIDMRGSEYALIGSDAWNSYMDGYASGREIFVSLGGRNDPTFDTWVRDGSPRLREHRYRGDGPMWDLVWYMPEAAEDREDYVGM